MQSNELNVLIVQEKIPMYRIPLFDGIGALEDIQLTLAHCDEFNSLSTNYKLIKYKMKSFGPFVLSTGIKNNIKDADIVVIMFDIKWITLMYYCLKHKQKVILWGHGYGRNTFANLVRQLIMKASKAILLYEEDAVMQLVNKGFNQDKIFYTGNTVNVKNARRKDGPRTQYIYMGRIQERKGLNDLLIAFSLISKSIPQNIGVTIVGDGELIEDLLMLAEELKISERVHFTGALYGDDLVPYYDQAIAYISPGHVGLGVLHSFAYGVPVITRSDTLHAPEVANIIQGETGLFYSGGPRELAKILVQLTNTQLSEKLGTGAYCRYVNERTMDKMVGRMNAAIRYVSG